MLTDMKNGWLVAGAELQADTALCPQLQDLPLRGGVVSTTILHCRRVPLHPMPSPYPISVRRSTLGSTRVSSSEPTPFPFSSGENAVACRAMEHP